MSDLSAMRCKMCDPLFEDIQDDLAIDIYDAELMEDLDEIEALING